MTTLASAYSVAARTNPQTASLAQALPGIMSWQEHIFSEGGIVNVSAVGGSYSPQAMTGASARQPLAQRYNAVFSQLTTPGSGVVTRDQFTQAFSSLNAPASFKSLGASAIFSSLDPNNTGAVSRQAFIQGLQQLSTQLTG